MRVQVLTVVAILLVTQLSGQSLPSAVSGQSNILSNSAYTVRTTLGLISPSRTGGTSFTVIGGIYRSLNLVTEVPLKKEEITVYPNPVHSFFRISAPSSTFELDVVNSLGINLLHLRITDASEEIDISKLPPGVYIARITDSLTSNINIIKLIKQ